jgi:hypothetical protein
LFCPEVCDWACLDPFGEFVHIDQQVGVAPGRLSQGPNDVQPPHGERPDDRNRLQGVSREISLAGIKLAALVGEYNLVGISDRGGTIKSLAERISHEGARRRVVATYARVDVSNKLVAVGDGMHHCRTPDVGCLYNSSSTMVNDLAILAMRLVSNRSGGSSSRSIQARYLARQSSVWGAGSVSMASASSAP